MNTTELLRLLKEVFGFSSFRPLQEEIIQDVLRGRDVLAVLPTGGGKSLCFQLPALARPGLTVVVSPLIALMKDQVDALRASGVAATFLNSSLDAAEARERLRALRQGEIRLLYVAPERLLLDGTLADLARCNVQLIAIDEAHCVSEWGHDFRPEYRKLSNLRRLFPRVPMLALTATATERVREDVAQQLALREPRRYVASFNRPNLFYRVTPKAGSHKQLIDFLKGRPQESGIIYCQSRKSTESMCVRLEEASISARPYHAGLSAAERSRHQDLFLQDRVRVVCATIAFGLGINKPNVRFVVHHDLPKNIESYYQETGRAGRDGLPAECLLFFSAGDAVKHTQFILEKPDPEEQARAREQLQQMVHFGETAGCRRSALLGYFGEEWPGGACGACDNCLAPRATYDGTLAAQKFLSCIFRVHQHSRFAVGLNHIVEVLTGAKSEKLLKWGHQHLTTYGIGNDISRPQWQEIGRELVRLGLVRQRADKFNVLELSEEGRLALKERRVITLTQPKAAPVNRPRRSGEIECDEALFERLRILRRKLAEERGVPPYIIFSDVSLRQMAREYPMADREFARIQGVGEKKRVEFAEKFIGEISAHLQDYPRLEFA